MLAFVFSFSFTSLPVSAASKYGTYGRRTYYYTVSKAKNIRIEKRGKAVGKYLNEWMEGGVKLAVSYAMGNYSIPFSIVEMVDMLPSYRTMKYKSPIWGYFHVQKE